MREGNPKVKGLPSLCFYCLNPFIVDGKGKTKKLPKQLYWRNWSLRFMNPSY